MKRDNTQILIASLLLLPLFFQLGSGLYKDTSYVVGSYGGLLWLPIPIAAITCFVGVVIFWKYQRAFISVGFIFFTIMLIIVSLVVGAPEYGAPGHAKLILFAQFTLPMFAMVLGQCYEYSGLPDSSNFEKGFLYTLAVIVPAQLLCTLLQGHSYLTPYLYLFSIYQHLQYVPVIFVSAFLVAFGRLWQFHKFKKILLILTPLMSIYAASSMSMLAIAMLFVGLLGFSIYWIRNFSDKTPFYLLLVGVFLTLGWGVIQFEKHDSPFASKFAYFSLSKGEYKSVTADIPVQNMPANVKERIAYWKYYAENITKSSTIFIFGHNEPPNRIQYPSAHNYYLDLIYNFGVLALLPMIVLLTYMLVMLYRFRRKVYISTSLMSLSAVVLVLVLVDNSLKVGLRQPYPGIVTFFLLGILITRLSEMSLKESKVINE